MNENERRARHSTPEVIAARAELARQEALTVEYHKPIRSVAGIVPVEGWWIKAYRASK